MRNVAAIVAVATAGVRHVAAQCDGGHFVGDGWCDISYNNLACDWDGGDCCQDKCTGFYCGQSIFACVDPSSSLTGTCNGTAAVLADIGDGECENYAAYNTLVCAWDGGDCCSKSCEQVADEGCTLFDCQDPTYTSGSGTGSCDIADACTSGESTTFGASASDFCACDPDCRYHGDCCSDYWTVCPQPTTTPQPGSASTTPADCVSETAAHVGDGFCDAVFNTEECGYDGGDCCQDTCSVPSVCGTTIYACVDPSSSNASTCTGAAEYTGFLGDGECVGFDYGAYNTAVCNWDGGDCCIGTCEGECQQSLYDCRDPNYGRGVGTGSCRPMTGEEAPCYSGHSSTYGEGADDVCECDSDCLRIGDCCSDYKFYCDFEEYTSTVAATTAQQPAATTAQQPAATTQQPSATTPAATTQRECLVYVASHVGDGFCDFDYNSDACGWDNGDCCASTCDGNYCGTTVFACVDPNATDAGTCGGDTTHIGDASCDLFTAYNSLVCAWDGGDCCLNSCVSNNGGEACEPNYDCLDPIYKFVGTGSCAGDDACASGQSTTYGATDAEFCACGQDCTYIGDCCADYYEYCADFSTVAPGSEGCDVAFSTSLGDGYCDSLGEYNTAKCGWDEGDCCSDTCETTSYDCPSDVMVCLNPASSSYVDPDVRTCEEAVSHYSYVGDGLCDFLGDYNTMLCGWDGGDCCESTCTSLGHNCLYSDFYCIDPNATDYGSGGPGCVVDYPSWLGDGICDTAIDGAMYNTDSCDWDLGDCCPNLGVSFERSCGIAVALDGTSVDCPDFTNATGAAEYECVDQRGCRASDLTALGNGICDDDANTYFCGWDLGDCCAPAGNGYCETGSNQNRQQCGWDNGDCCEETCQIPIPSFFGWECEFFSCVDPTYAAADAANISACDVSTISFLGDGYCDADAASNFNTAACQWDGGDCCPDTCESNALQGSQQWECGGSAYVCRDPDSSSAGSCVVSDDLANYANDGFCDQTAGLNTALCDWDQGDCCEETCVASAYDCTAFFCLDPEATGSLSTCGALFPSYVGDGWCDGSSYNNADCAWDGGDCCETSCEAAASDSNVDRHECGSNLYECIDPAYASNDLTDCELFPSRVGDGYCDTDVQLNIASCSWDGGDCCVSSCTSTTQHTCTSSDGDCSDPVYTAAAAATEPTMSSGDDSGVVAAVVCSIIVVIIIVVVVVIVRQRAKKRGIRQSTPATYMQNMTEWDANEGIGNYTGVSL